jgi:hypothetical protein
MDERGSHAAEFEQTEVWTGPPCSHCGSRDIVSRLTMNQSVEVGPFGLVYKAIGIFRGTELLYADLCRACGTVNRLWVKNPNRKWARG